MRRFLILSLLSLPLIISAETANAQKLHKTHGDWRVFTYKKGKDNFCYAASVPTKKTGNYRKRGEPFVLITYRPKTTDEVSLSSGYPYKAKSDVKLTIDKKTYKLFTQGERAWAYDASQDSKLISAMKRGNSMTVRGTSKIGTYSSDTYSLKGVTAAMTSMKKLCR